MPNPLPNPFNDSILNASTSTTDFGFDPSLLAAASKRLKFKLDKDLKEPRRPKKGFTFGCDPEGFLFDKKTNLPVPAAGIIPGTKHEPFKVKKGAIQVDGMAVEFNIDPASSYEEWEENITTVIKQLEKKLPKNLEIRWIPSVTFPEAAFDEAPDENKILGCDPDFDAWSGAPNPPPNPENPYVRCAGGHLHVGFTKDESLHDLQHLMNCQDLGKQLDWYLGGWSVFIDKDKVRRNLYGKMGAIRYKDYGLEYRVLSNFWVPTPEFRLEVWNRMVIAVDFMSSLYLPDRAGPKLTNWLREAIDRRNVHPELMNIMEFPLKTTSPARCRI